MISNRDTGYLSCWLVNVINVAASGRFFKGFFFFDAACNLLLNTIMLFFFHDRGFRFCTWMVKACLSFVLADRCATIFGEHSKVDKFTHSGSRQKNKMAIVKCRALPYMINEEWFRTIWGCNDSQSDLKELWPPPPPPAPPAPRPSLSLTSASQKNLNEENLSCNYKLTNFSNTDALGWY